jgi:hypothetical protein
LSVRSWVVGLALTTLAATSAAGEPAATQSGSVLAAAAPAVITPVARAASSPMARTLLAPVASASPLAVLASAVRGARDASGRLERRARVADHDGLRAPAERSASVVEGAKFDASATSMTVTGQLRAPAPGSEQPAHARDAWWLVRDVAVPSWSWTASPTPVPATVSQFGSVAPATIDVVEEAVRLDASPDVLELTPVHSRNPARILARWDGVLPLEPAPVSSNPGPTSATSGSAEVRETLTLAGSGVLAPYLRGSRQGEDAYASAFGCSIEGAAGLCLRPFASVEYRLQIAQEFKNQLGLPSRDSELSVEMRLNF